MTIALQIRRSEMYLSELHRDGAELITNVETANDGREVERRSANVELRRKIAAEMREESAKASVKLKAITQRWNQLDNFKDPMGMYDCLNLQKMRIDELMAQKDDLIAELHKALDQADQQYQLDQITKLNDLECIVDRIDSQVDVMKRAYRSHLDILQSTVDMERKNFKITESNRWDQLYEELQVKDQECAENTILESAKYNDEIAELCTKHQEINRATKIRLDRDNDRLQVELQNVKADVLLNSEKLAYNFKVLQKRAGENVTVKAQQKRLLARLNEVVLTTRDKYTHLKRTASDEVNKLSQEVQKLHSSLVCFGGKSDAFSAASSQKVNPIESTYMLLTLFYLVHERLEYSRIRMHSPSAKSSNSRRRYFEKVSWKSSLARSYIFRIVSRSNKSSETVQASRSNTISFTANCPQPTVARPTKHFQICSGTISGHYKMAAGQRRSIVVKPEQLCRNNSSGRSDITMLWN